MNYKNLHPYVKVITIALTIIAIVALGVVFIFGRSFIYPVFLAILFAYLVYPLTKFLERTIKLRKLSIFLSVLVAIIVFAGLIFFLYRQLSNFLSDFPELREQASENLKRLEGQLVQLFPSFFQENSLNGLIEKALGAQENAMKKVLNATTGTLVGLGLQPVYIYFMLYYRDHFKRFLVDITAKRHHEKLENVLTEVGAVTKNYVSGVFMVVAILCVLNTIGLTIVGVKYALMFGILSAIMNFIPYFGTLIGGAFPLAYTLVSPHPENALGVIILFIIIQFTENNILTPTITGGRVAINPLFTIFSIIIGGLMWGLPGMFAAVPFVGMFKVVCSHVRFLKPLARVISPEHPDRPSAVTVWFMRNILRKKSH